MSANRGAKITLHWLEASRAQRILWLLEELHLTYDLQTYKRINQRAPPELSAIHPLGKSPIVTIVYPNLPSTPVVLAESAAVVEHLVENFDGGRLVPRRVSGWEATTQAEMEPYLRYRYFMHYAEGSLMSLLFTGLLMKAIREAPVPFFVKPVTSLLSNKVSDEYLKGNYKSNFEFLENQLATSPEGGEYLCGKTLTAADILMGFPVMAAFELAISKEEYPRLAAYVGRLQAIQSYKDAVKKVEEAEGTPYKLL